MPAQREDGQPPSDDIDASPRTGERLPFLPDIHRMRGLSILLIVATHCMYAFQWEQHRWAEELLYDLLDDSTVIFVFIAGYLFKHGAVRFSYGRYLGTKFRNVIAPYLLVSLPAIALELWHGGHVFDTPPLNELSLPAKVLHLYLYPGLHFDYALWFVPVVALYYLAAPLLLWLSNRPRGYSILCVLVPLSALMHRPTYSHDHNLALALYFLSAYVLGMWSCRYRERMSPLIDANLVLFAAVFVLVLCGHLLWSSHHGKYTFSEFMNFQGQGVIDWIYLQKLLLLPVLLGLAWRFRHARLPWLDYLADVSFTVFFLHMYVIRLFEAALHWKFYEVDVVSYALLIAAAVLVPCIIASSTRRMFPGWSRSLVGS